jgi:hypothetical protein
MFGKLFKNMYIMEKNKHFPPKFTDNLLELAEHFNIIPVTSYHFPLP